MSAGSVRVNIAANERMVLPAPVGEALAIQGDTRIFVVVENGEARVGTSATRIARARELH